MWLDLVILEASSNRSDPVISNASIICLFSGRTLPGSARTGKDTIRDAKLKPERHPLAEGALSPSPTPRKAMNEADPSVNPVPPPPPQLTSAVRGPPRRGAGARRGSAAPEGGHGAVREGPGGTEGTVRGDTEGIWGTPRGFGGAEGVLSPLPPPTLSGVSLATPRRTQAAHGTGQLMAAPRAGPGARRCRHGGGGRGGWCHRCAPRKGGAEAGRRGGGRWGVCVERAVGGCWELISGAGKGSW